MMNFFKAHVFMATFSFSFALKGFLWLLLRPPIFTVIRLVEEPAKFEENGHDDDQPATLF
jgi:hypothetical protein